MDKVKVPEYESPFEIPSPYDFSHNDWSCWYTYREKFAETGDTAWLKTMLDYVTPDNPPEKVNRKEVEEEIDPGVLMVWGGAIAAIILIIISLIFI